MEAAPRALGAGVACLMLAAAAAAAEPPATSSRPNGIASARSGTLQAGRVGKRARLSWQRSPSGRLRAEMAAGSDARDVARRLGIELLTVPAYAPRSAIFRVRGADAMAAAARLRAEPGVREVEVLAGRPRVRHGTPDDPLFPLQWHLLNTGQDGGQPGIDIHVEPVWGDFAAGGTRGRGIRIGVIDDGVEAAHPDLRVDAASARDWNDDSPDVAEPVFPDDNHGTAVAGIAAARGHNDLGVCGVAPDAAIVPLRLLGGNRDGFPADPDDWQEAEAFAWLAEAGPATIHVKNNSWGVPDGFDLLGGPGPLARAALDYSTRFGRGGLGTVIVFSAGNGGDRFRPWETEDSNLSGYANSPHVIAVAGLTASGRVAYYSEPGANILVSAPAEAAEGGQNFIVTTDRTGTDAGYNQNPASATRGDYTRNFNGTSAAAPIVSGVAALLLEAEPSLGWRDVQEILIRSSRRVQPEDSGWSVNAAGFHFHHDFGAGLVDAAAACELARGWRPLPHRKSRETERSGAVEIPDGGEAEVALFLTGSGLRAEHVVVTVDLRHPRRGDLEIWLESPYGTRSRLLLAHQDPNADLREWPLMTVHCWGERADGRWRLQVRDTVAGAGGTLLSARLRAYGTSAVPDAYERWLQERFGAGVVAQPELRATVWGEGADPDADGFPNVAEALLGMDPARPDRPPRMEVERLGTEAVLRWSASGLPGLRVLPEWSADLRRWHRSGERVDGTTRTITLREGEGWGEARLAAGTLPHGFLRITVARE